MGYKPGPLTEKEIEVLELRKSLSLGKIALRWGTSKQYVRQAEVTAKEKMYIEEMRKERRGK